MSFSRRFDLFAPNWRTNPSLLLHSPLDEQLDFVLDILNPNLSPKARFFDPPVVHWEYFEYLSSDLASSLFPPFVASFRGAETEIQVQSLRNRIAALEAGFDRSIGGLTEARDRKFKWTAEIKGLNGEESDRKYRVMAEAKATGERSVKWTKELKGTGSYTFEASTAPARAAGFVKEQEKCKKGEKKKGPELSSKLVEIEDEQNPASIIIRKAFAKKICKGKRKELSPLDAAVLIQLSFRSYLVRRSQVVRGLRELAVAKAKLKEIRTLFNNLSYRRRLVRDAEEQQRFTERIIVLLLTVEAIQGSDFMIRSAKKSIIDELELKLDVVDPQPAGKLGSLRRKFDLPEGGCIAGAIARNVTRRVVELIDEHGNCAASESSA